MILFALSLIVLAIALIIATAIALCAGELTIVLFGDVIVFVLIVWAIVKLVKLIKKIFRK